MELFNVYSFFPLKIIKGKGVYVFNEKGEKYLDFYGGHAVISIGHSHPYYIKCIKNQINKIGFYSNTICIPQQRILAKLLGNICGYTDYNLFLCNSGAESVENALKISSFYNNKSGVIAFKKSFHGRTSGALSVTDNKKISTKFNKQHKVFFVEKNNLNKIEKILMSGNISAIIIEGIQGIAGIIDPGLDFLIEVQFLCKKYNSLFIIDEIQSGYGRTGNFFAHQKNNIKLNPDLITIAKGMGNGFPIGGVLIHPKIKSFNGMLGTTFGGNYLACSAAIAVLKIIKNEKLIYNSFNIGNLFISLLKKIYEIKEIRGRGLMLGLLFNFPVKNLINVLLLKQKVFVGASSDPNILRILPPLNITLKDVTLFIKKLKKALKYIKKYEK